MIQLMRATASQEVLFGPFLDDTDGKTAETGLTIANTDIKIWKNGASSLVNKNSGGATHLANGLYLITLDATDTSTWGPMEIHCHMAGALPVAKMCHVGPLDILGLAPSGGILPQADALFAIFGQYRPARVNDPSATTTQFIIEPVSYFVDGINDDDYFNGWTVVFGAFGGNALGTSQVSDYNGTTWRVTVSPALPDAPGDDTLLVLIPPYLSNVPLTAAVAGVQSYVDDLESRLTAARASYLDNLSSGAVATASALATVNAYVDELEARLTAARAGYLDNLNSGVPLSAAAVDAVIDEVVEGSITVRQALRLILSVAAGKSAGGGGSTITFRDMADSKNRISATVDANGNRTAVTRDAT